jgi:hypothetical protein
MCNIDQLQEVSHLWGRFDCKLHLAWQMWNNCILWKCHWNYAVPHYNSYPILELSNSIVKYSTDFSPLSESAKYFMKFQMPGQPSLGLWTAMPAWWGLIHCTFMVLQMSSWAHPVSCCDVRFWGRQILKSESCHLTADVFCVHSVCAVVSE